MSTVFQQPYGADARWLTLPPLSAHPDDLWFSWAERVAGSPAVWGPKHIRITHHCSISAVTRYAACHARIDRTVNAAQWLAQTLPRVDSDRMSSPVRVSDVRPVLETMVGRLNDIEFTAAVIYPGHDLASMDLDSDPKTTVSKIGLDWHTHRTSREPFPVGRRPARWLARPAATVEDILDALDRIPVDDDGVCPADQRMDRCAAVRHLPTIAAIANKLVDLYPATTLTSDTDRFAYSRGLAHTLEAEHSRHVSHGDVIIAAAVAGYGVVHQHNSVNAFIGIDENIAQMLRARALTLPPQRRHLTAA